MASSRLFKLATAILENASIIDATLAAEGELGPSFEPSSQTVFPPELTVPRDVVLDSTQELHDLLLAPMSLLQRKGSHNNMSCMKAICRYDIVNCFEPGQTITFENLAKASGLAEKPLKHLLRHAMTMRIFSEPEKGLVAHTAASAIIRDPNCMTWLTSGTEDLWPSSVKLVDAFSKWPGSQEPNHTGWNIAHNVQEPLYQKLATDPKFATRFGVSMTAMISNNPAFDPIHLHNSFDWASLESVVDVGGSHGSVAVSLATTYNNLRLVSQDLDNTIQSAPPISDELHGRVDLMSHDFFTEQPVRADAYLFRWIFHNWPDKYSIKILQALIPALKSGARILVQDGCLPEPGVLPNWREKDLRDMDLLMNAYFNSWERDAEEWQDLFAQADPRFKFIGITQPRGSALALIEVSWSG
ncbi:S-adenosyl-L-methionine-dependent methyltransferase [Clohesyomyces aquaticus]|uniref:S-adenosyl-L-methionine-dependent methyltransferase n=1 Tax=Clohesyomyces aquaticus TaxID=1231657 RepID=A0A1Y1YWP1_9PLEO|nr:S-adenosyl-L-methionine-dependent methyltransferase [Clohesyomyces aquaticus]